MLKLLVSGRLKKQIKIEYFNPQLHGIENPQTGFLKNQDFMKDSEYKDGDYCKYGCRYRKRTRLWLNFNNWTPRPLCRKDCGNIVDGRHIEVAQRLPQKKKADWGDNYVIHKQEDLSKEI